LEISGKHAPSGAEVLHVDKAWVTGLNEEQRKHILGMTLKDLKLPIRARVRPESCYGGKASIARNEAGELWAEGSDGGERWLEEFGDGNKEKGARNVLDDLCRYPLNQLVNEIDG